MRLHMHLLKSVSGKATLAGMILGGFLFFAGAPGAQAHDRDDYRRPADRYDHDRFRGTIERHEFYGPRAGHWREERHEAFGNGWRDRDGCWHRC